MNDDGADAGRPGDLDIVRTVSLTSALEAQIERLIVDGELKPGDRVNENRLAERFGTSRGPLREALRSLEAKGFLHAIRHRGVFVRRITLGELLEIYDVRAALFGLAARLACGKMTPLLIDQLRRLIAEMDDVAAIGDLAAYRRPNFVFHNALVATSQNGTLMADYVRHVKKTHLYEMRGSIPAAALVEANTEHAEIVAALDARDEDRSHHAAYAHVVGQRRRRLESETAASAH